MKKQSYIAKDTKIKLFKRADNKCEKCKSSCKLEIHHIVPKQKGLDDSLVNLQLLCHSCHSKNGISNRTSKNKILITINITFDDKEFEKLLKIKKDTSWHDFIMQLLEMKQ